jgi:hypothetical protein
MATCARIQFLVYCEKCERYLVKECKEVEEKYKGQIDLLHIPSNISAISIFNSEYYPPSCYEETYFPFEGHNCSEKDWLDEQNWEKIREQMYKIYGYYTSFDFSLVE